MPQSGWSGQRIIAVMCGVLIAATAAFGAALPLAVEGLRPPRYLFLVEFPATSLGFAAYGALTMITILALPLAAVVLVSRYAVEDDRD